MLHVITMDVLCVTVADALSLSGRSLCMSDQMTIQQGKGEEEKNMKDNFELDPALRTGALLNLQSEGRTNTQRQSARLSYKLLHELVQGSTPLAKSSGRTCPELCLEIPRAEKDMCRT